MSTTIDAMRAEHKLLVDHLSKAKELGCYTPAAREFIYKVEQEFKDHLKKEDAELYRALHQVAKTDTYTKNVLESFARELDAVTKDVVNFFEAHAKNSNHEHFEKDIVHLIASVEARIVKEEHLLYPLYEKRVEKAAQ